jgi:uncharacterized protein YndB with AHSA1/START domain
MNAEPDGEIRQTGETFEVVFKRRYAKPIEKVWAALTVPERIADWLATAKVEPDLRLGARFELYFATQDYRVVGEIVALDPPRLIAWTWPDAQHAQSIVRFELTADGAGCLLTLRQSELSRRHLVEVAAGWHTHLEAVPGAIEGARTPWSSERETVHADRYKQALAVD